MIIRGVAILAGCFIIGQLIGETLGRLLHIDANVGGVGFAMLLLIVCNQWMEKNGLLTQDIEDGVMFWSKMYIPVIVAMSATQNVSAALSGGWIALLAGVVPVVICFMLMPIFSKISKQNSPELPNVIASDSAA
jgi:malonate transporter MadL subunit